MIPPGDGRGPELLIFRCSRCGDTFATESAIARCPSCGSLEVEPATEPLL